MGLPPLDKSKVSKVYFCTEFLGVTWDKSQNTFHARVLDANKNVIFLGEFNSSDEAVKAVKQFGDLFGKPCLDNLSFDTNGL